MNRQSMFDIGYRMPRTGAWGRSREMIWGGRWEGGSGLGTHVHLWQINVNEWQNQYSIVKQNKVKIKILKNEINFFKTRHWREYIPNIPSIQVYSFSLCLYIYRKTAHQLIRYNCWVTCNARKHFLTWNIFCVCLFFTLVLLSSMYYITLRICILLTLGIF